MHPKQSSIFKQIKGLNYGLREHKVMLDADLARLYQVPTKALVQALKQNMIPTRLHVSANYRRTQRFEVTICDLKRPDRQTLGTVCIY